MFNKCFIKNHSKLSGLNVTLCQRQRKALQRIVWPKGKQSSEGAELQMQPGSPEGGGNLIQQFDFNIFL